MELREIEEDTKEEIDGEKKNRLKERKGENIFAGKKCDVN